MRRCSRSLLECTRSRARSISAVSPRAFVLVHPPPPSSPAACQIPPSSALSAPKHVPPHLPLLRSGAPQTFRRPPRSTLPSPAPHTVPSPAPQHFPPSP